MSSSGNNLHAAGSLQSSVQHIQVPHGSANTHKEPSATLIHHGLAAQAHAVAQNSHQKASRPLPRTPSPRPPTAYPVHLIPHIAAAPAKTPRTYQTLPHDVQKHIVEEMVSSSRAQNLDKFWPFEHDSKETSLIEIVNGVRRYHSEIKTLRHLAPTFRHIIDEGWQDGVEASELIELVGALQGSELNALKASRLDPDTHQAPRSQSYTHAYTRLSLLQRKRYMIRSMMLKFSDLNRYHQIREILPFPALRCISVDLSVAAASARKTYVQQLYSILHSFPKLRRIQLCLEHAHPLDPLATVLGPAALKIIADLNKSLQDTDRLTLDATERHVLIQEWFPSYSPHSDLKIIQHFCTMEFLIRKHTPLQFIGLMHTPIWPIFCSNWDQTQEMFFSNHRAPLPHKLVLQMEYHDTTSAEAVTDMLRRYFLSDCIQYPDAYIHLHLRSPATVHSDVEKTDVGIFAWSHESSTLILWFNPNHSPAAVTWTPLALESILNRLTQILPTVTKKLYMQIDDCSPAAQARMMEVVDGMSWLLNDCAHDDRSDHIWSCHWDVHLYTNLPPHHHPVSHTASESGSIKHFYSRTGVTSKKGAEMVARIEAHLDTASWANIITHMLTVCLPTLTVPVQFIGFDPTIHYSQLVRFNKRFKRDEITYRSATSS